MPWKVKGTGVYKKTATGWELESKHDSRIKAIRKLRLLYMIESGKKPTGKKSTLERMVSK